MWLGSSAMASHNVLSQSKLYISFSGAPPFIYLILNKTVRKQCRFRPEKFPTTRKYFRNMLRRQPKKKDTLTTLSTTIWLMNLLIVDEHIIIINLGKWRIFRIRGRVRERSSLFHCISTIICGILIELTDAPPLLGALVEGGKPAPPVGGGDPLVGGGEPGRPEGGGGGGDPRTWRFSLQ